MFRSITLEMSLKPFKETNESYIRDVCRGMFRQWEVLLRNREEICVMLWVGDGGELLDYTGELEKPFEWGCYCGTANFELVGDLPKETGLHVRKQFYMDNPPVMTWRILREIIRILKEEGNKLFPTASILVGETLDIGPEFAVSDFKYRRHPECCKGHGCDKFGFVDVTTLLHADDYPYAAYPDGLPEGTCMGTFMGRQANLFLRDMGFDYIWLSNGLGFCYESWRAQGEIYDGTDFHPEKLGGLKEKIFQFWRQFREETDFPVRTRGTNFSVGIDYGKDGVPLRDIYKGVSALTPPPNSPWTAILDDMGIEILGQLTRNCSLPGDDYMFRYYVHDPWWVNSPWYDRYEGSPHDIYVPMSLTRVDRHGAVQPPTMLSILTVDNSWGDLPDQCACEVLPHLLKAEKDVPDLPGPLVLVYPMEEYTTSEEASLLREMYFGDTFLKTALNKGFPLATAVSADNFSAQDLQIYRGCILVAPAALENEKAEEKLAVFAAGGGSVITYGSRERLESVRRDCRKVDIEGEPEQMLRALSGFGYEILFERTADESPLPSMTLTRSDNAYMFNVYSRDTTVRTKMKFPSGAPVINGYNAQIEDGYAHYQFPRSLHGECRVFVTQERGIVRAQEEAPVNMKYRRKITVSGLDHAAVCIFPESRRPEEAIISRGGNDGTPVAERGWELRTDSPGGKYLYSEDVSGKITLCMT